MREKKERKKKAKSQISTPFDHFRFQISNFGITSPQPHSHPFFIRVHPSVSMLQATWLTVYTPGHACWRHTMAFSTAEVNLTIWQIDEIR